MLGDLLRETAARAPDAVAFVDGARRLTYAEWDRLSDRAAFHLASAGVRAGDVVALLLQPGIAYPVAYLGAAKIGAVTAGINPRLAQPEIGRILEHSLARALVTDRPPARNGTVSLSPERLIAPGGAPPSAAPAPGDPVAIVFTSGTTGAPKGATFTHGALAAVREIEDSGETGPSRGVQGIPMAHMGFMTKIASFIARASTAVLTSRWTAREALSLIERERLTTLGGVPTQLALMLRDPAFARADLSSLRSVVIGGAPASPELVRAIREGFGAPVTVRYSCTELAVCTSTRPDDPDHVVAETVGRARPGVELRVENPNEDGVGEIAARSPAMMRGYWRAPDETGLFRTGDLGRVGDDGNLRLAGRAKEMFIRGGYNVYPLEVENALLQHPSVAAAAVIGIPDDVLGERGLALVVPAGAPADERELKMFVAERLADYKVPDMIEFRESLPMTPMFKVDKRALEAEVRDVPR
jgi:acyl-CoA synthetase (AMP-forming)/AMP-acid ligase II